ncbi:hypothetical protein JCM6882_001260 [Rhodosporidiobolus microsporus]
MESCFVCGQSLNGDASFVQHHLNSCLDRQGSSRSSYPGAPPLAPHATNSSTASFPPTAPLSPSTAQFNADAALALSLAHSLNAPDASAAAAVRAAREEEASARRDRELALALARAQEVEAGMRVPREGTNGADGGERESCPCCEARWEDMGLSFSLSPFSSAASSTSFLPGPSSSAASPYASTPVSSSADPPPDPLTHRLKVEEKRRKHVEKCLEGRAKAFAEGATGEEGEEGEHGAWDLEAEESGGGGKVPSWTGRGKDAVLGTPGLIHLLHRSLLASSTSSHGRTREAYLADGAVEHVSTRLRDWGWGCGYKNAQMLFSSFRHLPCYAPLFAFDPTSSSTGASSSASVSGKRLALGGAECEGRDVVKPVPTIREWQDMIEEAWKAGHDPLGRSHFNGHLVGSRRWIGTTEVYTALTWMGVRAKIIDFPKVPTGEGTHQSLVRWITNYFSSASTPSPPSSASSSPDPSSSTSPPVKNAFTLLASSRGSPIRLTSKQPLYLQHRGHSRTVVGVEIGKSEGGAGTKGAKGKGRKLAGKVVGKGTGGEGEKEDELWLLIFDPGKPIPQDLKHAASSLESRSSPSTTHSPSFPSTSTSSPSASAAPFPPLKKLKSSSPPPPGRGGFGGGGRKGEEAESMPKYGDVLKVFRVNMNQLKRREEYQILYVEPGPPLTSYEKAQRREVKSRVAPQKGAGAGGGARVA